MKTFRVSILQAWEAYSDKDLVRMVDPTLNMNFPEEEAVRFLMVSLLCVQESAKLRPKMSVVVKTLTNEINIEDFEIARPGFLSDLTNIRFRHKSSSESTSTYF